MDLVWTNDDSSLADIINSGIIQPYLPHQTIKDAVQIHGHNVYVLILVDDVFEGEGGLELVS